MAAIAVYYTNSIHSNPQILRLQSMGFCLKCIHSKYYKNEITGTYLNLKKYIIQLEFFHIALCHRKAMVKAMYFQNKYEDPLFLSFSFISYHKMILYMQ